MLQANKINMHHYHSLFWVLWQIFLAAKLQFFSSVLQYYGRDHTGMTAMFLSYFLLALHSVVVDTEELFHGTAGKSTALEEQNCNNTCYQTEKERNHRYIKSDCCEMTRIYIETNSSSKKHTSIQCHSNICQALSDYFIQTHSTLSKHSITLAFILCNMHTKLHQQWGNTRFSVGHWPAT